MGWSLVQSGTQMTDLRKRRGGFTRLMLQRLGPKKVATPPQSSHRVIEIREVDFNTMHNALYFFYTGRVNMHCAKTKDGTFKNSWTTPDGYPAKCDFTRLQTDPLTDLEAMAERYLTATCTTENITQRIFDVSISTYEKLVKVYLDYLATVRSETSD